ncbi:hypothetical protein FA13DRAFT_622693 [Coprinellus micaceus]|uniref:Uncharacterized protein n=1 Tax=Coprinellus micaceus TaxID=71717 RepID=A0A4Y7T6V7_COPMI|nr:hypothetical protein FA13DRAFT_622693 [Coprinellus micaceus]
MRTILWNADDSPSRTVRSVERDSHREGVKEDSKNLSRTCESKCDSPSFDDALTLPLAPPTPRRPVNPRCQTAAQPGFSGPPTKNTTHPPLPLFQHPSKEPQSHYPVRRRSHLGANPPSAGVVNALATPVLRSKPKILEYSEDDAHTRHSEVCFWDVQPCTRDRISATQPMGQ